MFGFLKNLLRKPVEQPANVESDPVATAACAVTEPPAAPASANARSTALRKHPVAHNGRGIEVPLQHVLATLPLELQPRVREADVGDLTIIVSLEKVLAQLSRGAVRITFGELRQCAPDIFTSETDRDRVLVSLPLADILSRLNPALITRRRAQRQIEVPAEISSPFDAHGRGLIFAVGPAKPEAPQAFAGGPPRHIAPTPPGPVTPARGTTPAAPASVPGPVPLSAPPVRLNLTAAVTPPPPSAVGPVAPPPPIPLSPAAKPAPPARVTPKPSVVARVAPAAQAPLPKPVPTPVPVAPPPPELVMPQALETAPPAAEPVVAELQTPAPAAEPAETKAPVAPAPSPAAAPVSPGEPIVVKLTAVAEAWPESVRKEIVALRLVDASLALPADAVGQALKQGRIVFSWKMVRSWIKPGAPATDSPHDAVVVELPLKVVAPLFLAKQQQKTHPQQKVAIDEDIPNLFFGFPQPETGTPVAQATARPADTNFYVWDESSDTVRVHESEVKRGPSPGTKFVAKYATPNEVVSRASALDGVNGALIALPDGLMVANRLPPEMNADTLAAFLPQIFGKVSQCTKELRMGELNNLNFTVGNVPWKIFRVNAIFFAAFGRAGEPLPTAQLAALAAELDHKPK